MTLSVLRSDYVSESQLGWTEYQLSVDDDSPDALIHVQGFAEGAPTGGTRIFEHGQPVSIPTELYPSVVSFVGAKSTEDLAYIALGVDLGNDVSIELVGTDGAGFNLEGDLGIHARVAGSVQIDGSGTARNVIVLADDPRGRKVLGSGQSDGTGAFDIDFHGYSGPVIAMAVDDYGRDFETEKAFNLGDLIHPSTPNGYVFEVTTAGTTGTSEPDWNTEGTTQSGSVTFNAQPFYRPIASGPLLPEKLSDSEPPAPWLIGSSDYMDSRAKYEAWAGIPYCEEGDVIIAWGITRGPDGDLTDENGNRTSSGDAIMDHNGNGLPGWTRVPNPPPPPSGDPFPQWTFCFYKVADGSESAEVIHVRESISTSGDRLTLQTAVVRGPTGHALSVEHLASVRQPEGPASDEPLSVQNTNKNALLIGVTSWVYSTFIDNGTTYFLIDHPKARQLGINYRMYYDTSDNEGNNRQIRNGGVYLTAGPNESISVPIEIDVANSSDSRSDIWLAVTVDP